jgi:RecA/RadA recombinase
MILFYDSERGMNKDYFKAVGIDPERVVHVKLYNISQLKKDMVQKFENAFEKDDKVFVLVDSIGNLASRKEIEDAKDGKDVADMTRAKDIKSLGRIITPYITDYDIPYVQIAHVYQTQDRYPQTVVSGGTGIMLISDNVWIVNRQKEKDGTDVVGHNFDIVIEKSRFVKERSKFSVQVSFDGGIKRWSGLKELAEEAGVIHSRRGGQKGNIYTLTGVEGEFLKDDIEKWSFWEQLVELDSFKGYVKDRYQLATVDLVQEEEDAESE